MAPHRGNFPCAPAKLTVPTHVAVIVGKTKTPLTQTSHVKLFIIRWVGIADGRGVARWKLVG